MGYILTGLGWSSSTSPPSSTVSLYSPRIHVAANVSDSCEMSIRNDVYSFDAVYACSSEVCATSRMKADRISSLTELPA